MSVNVAQPATVQIGGKPTLTSIGKAPVAGPVFVGRDNLEGDRQSDLTVHGGAHQAAYAYPREHYAYWEAELESAAFPPGQFGENLTVEGLLEAHVRVGDRLRVGSALLQVTHPRIPCAKLANRMREGPDFVQRFLASGRVGFYLRVLEEGTLQAGVAVERVDSDPGSVTIAEYIDTYAHRKKDPAALQRILASRDLSAGEKGAKEQIEELLRRAEKAAR